MRAVGIAGTAKNTGKTTSLNAILVAAAERGLRTAITSIGYDGEEFDHLTGLPKPRVTVTEGMLVATAVGTLRGATAGVERVGQTGVLTTLGEVVVVRVLKPGLIPLAGPPTGVGVTAVVQALAAHGADLALVDGAFGRMAPFAVLDGVILATGGARSRDIARLAGETAALSWMFALPTLQAEAAALTAENLLSEGSAQRFLQQLPSTGALRVTGAVSLAALEALAGWAGWNDGARCIFTDPIQLALAGDPLRVRAALERLALRARLGLAKAVELKAVTVNPFYPDGSCGQQFEARYLDATALQSALASAVPVPVVNVLRDGAARLI